MLCQSCGNPKDDSEVYEMPPDPSRVASVTDPRMLRQATAGANWRCAFCGSDARALDGSCAQCGATSREGKAVAPRVARGPELAPARRVARSRLVLALAVVVALFACGIVSVVALRARPRSQTVVAPSEPEYRDVEARAASARFEQSVIVERWTIVEKEGFDEQKPKDAMDVRSLGERVHHVDKVQEGTTTETYTETVTVMENETYTEQEQCGQDCTTLPQSCHEECTNNQNGYATCHTVCSGGGQSCSPRFCSVTKTRMVPKPTQVQKTRTVPKMVDVPRMAPFFHWKQWDWQHNRTLTEKGTGYSLRWPDADAIGLNKGLKQGEKERERRTSEYVVDLAAADGTKLTLYPKRAEEYLAYQNATAVLRVHRYAGVELVSGPKPVAAAPDGSAPASQGTRYRVGDHIQYRYSGENTPSPVLLDESIVAQTGNRLEIRVVAKRGAEQREWIQVVTDTPDNQKNNRVDELFEVTGGARRKLENKDNRDLYRLYAWVVFTPDGRATDTKLESKNLVIGSTSYSCQTHRGKNSWHGRALRFVENECADFLWTHGPASYTDERTGHDIWRVEVSSYGGG